MRKLNYSVRRAGKAISDVKRNIVGLDLGSKFAARKMYIVMVIVGPR